LLPLHIIAWEPMLGTR